MGEENGSFSSVRSPLQLLGRLSAALGVTTVSLSVAIYALLKSPTLSKQLVYMHWFRLPHIDFTDPQKPQSLGLFAGVPRTRYVPALSPESGVSVPCWVTAPEGYVFGAEDSSNTSTGTQNSTQDSTSTPSSSTHTSLASTSSSISAAIPTEAEEEELSAGDARALAGVAMALVAAKQAQEESVTEAVNAESKRSGSQGGEGDDMYLDMGTNMNGEASSVDSACTPPCASSSSAASHIDSSLSLDMDAPSLSPTSSLPPLSPLPSQHNTFPRTIATTTTARAATTTAAAPGVAIAGVPHAHPTTSTTSPTAPRPPYRAPCRCPHASLPPPESLFPGDRPVFLYLHGNCSHRGEPHRVILYKFLSSRVFRAPHGMESIQAKQVVAAVKDACTVFRKRRGTVSDGVRGGVRDITFGAQGLLGIEQVRVPRTPQRSRNKSIAKKKIEIVGAGDGKCVDKNTEPGVDEEEEDGVQGRVARTAKLEGQSIKREKAAGTTEEEAQADTEEEDVYVQVPIVVYPPVPDWTNGQSNGSEEVEEDVYRSVALVPGSSPGAGSGFGGSGSDEDDCARAVAVSVAVSVDGRARVRVRARSSTTTSHAQAQPQTSTSATTSTSAAAASALAGGVLRTNTNTTTGIAAAAAAVVGDRNDKDNGGTAVNPNSEPSSSPPHLPATSTPRTATSTAPSLESPLCASDEAVSTVEWLLGHGDAPPWLRSVRAPTDSLRATVGGVLKGLAGTFGGWLGGGVKQENAGRAEESAEEKHVGKCDGGSDRDLAQLATATAFNSTSATACTSTSASAATASADTTTTATAQALTTTSVTAAAPTISANITNKPNTTPSASSISTSPPCSRFPRRPRRRRCRPTPPTSLPSLMSAPHAWVVSMDYRGYGDNLPQHKARLHAWAHAYNTQTHTDTPIPTQAHTHAQMHMQIIGHGQESVLTRDVDNLSTAISSIDKRDDNLYNHDDNMDKYADNMDHPISSLHLSTQSPSCLPSSTRYTHAQPNCPTAPTTTTSNATATTHTNTVTGASTSTSTSAVAAASVSACVLCPWCRGVQTPRSNNPTTTTSDNTRVGPAATTGAGGICSVAGALAEAANTNTGNSNGRAAAGVGDVKVTSSSSSSSYFSLPSSSQAAVPGPISPSQPHAPPTSAPSLVPPSPLADIPSVDVTPSPTGLLTDALAVFDWLTLTCRVHPSRIIIWGHSLGTGVTAKLAEVLAARGARKREVTARQWCGLGVGEVVNAMEEVAVMMAEAEREEKHRKQREIEDIAQQRAQILRNIVGSHMVELREDNMELLYDDNVSKPADNHNQHVDNIGDASYDDNNDNVCTHTHARARPTTFTDNSNTIATAASTAGADAAKPSCVSAVGTATGTARDSAVSNTTTTIDATSTLASVLTSASTSMSTPVSVVTGVDADVNVLGGAIDQINTPTATHSATQSVAQISQESSLYPQPLPSLPSLPTPCCSSSPSLFSSSPPTSSSSSSSLHHTLTTLTAILQPLFTAFAAQTQPFRLPAAHTLVHTHCLSRTHVQTPVSSQPRNNVCTPMQAHRKPALSSSLPPSPSILTTSTSTSTLTSTSTSISAVPAPHLPMPLTATQTTQNITYALSSLLQNTLHRIAHIQKNTLSQFQHSKKYQPKFPECSEYLGNPGLGFPEDVGFMSLLGGYADTMSALFSLPLENALVMAAHEQADMHLNDHTSHTHMEARKQVQTGTRADLYPSVVRDGQVDDASAVVGSGIDSSADIGSAGVVDIGTRDCPPTASLSSLPSLSSMSPPSSPHHRTHTRRHTQVHASPPSSLASVSSIFSSSSSMSSSTHALHTQTHTNTTVTATSADANLGTNTDIDAAHVNITSARATAMDPTPNTMLHHLGSLRAHASPAGIILESPLLSIQDVVVDAKPFCWLVASGDRQERVLLDRRAEDAAREGRLGVLKECVRQCVEEECVACACHHTAHALEHPHRYTCGHGSGSGTRTSIDSSYGVTRLGGLGRDIGAVVGEAYREGVGSHEAEWRENECACLHERMAALMAMLRQDDNSSPCDDNLSPHVDNSSLRTDNSSQPTKKSKKNASPLSFSTALAALAAQPTSPSSLHVPSLPSSLSPAPSTRVAMLAVLHRGLRAHSFDSHHHWAAATELGLRSSLLAAITVDAYVRAHVVATGLAKVVKTIVCEVLLVAAALSIRQHDDNSSQDVDNVDNTLSSLASTSLSRVRATLLALTSLLSLITSTSTSSSSSHSHSLSFLKPPSIGLSLAHTFAPTLLSALSPPAPLPPCLLSHGYGHQQPLVPLPSLLSRAPIPPQSAHSATHSVTDTIAHPYSTNHYLPPTALPPSLPRPLPTHTPVLILHGLRDHVVPATHGITIWHRLASDRAHAYAQAEKVYEYVDQIVQWGVGVEHMCSEEYLEDGSAGGHKDTEEGKTDEESDRETQRRNEKDNYENGRDDNNNKHVDNLGERDNKNYQRADKNDKFPMLPSITTTLSLLPTTPAPALALTTNTDLWGEETDDIHVDNLYKPVDKFYKHADNSSVEWKEAACRFGMAGHGTITIRSAAPQHTHTHTHGVTAHTNNPTRTTTSPATSSTCSTNIDAATTSIDATNAAGIVSGAHDDLCGHLSSSSAVVCGGPLHGVLLHHEDTHETQTDHDTHGRDIANVADVTAGLAGVKVHIIVADTMTSGAGPGASAVSAVSIDADGVVPTDTCAADRDSAGHASDRDCVGASDIVSASIKTPTDTQESVYDPFNASQEVPITTPVPVVCAVRSPVFADPESVTIQVTEKAWHDDLVLYQASKMMVAAFTNAHVYRS